MTNNELRDTFAGLAMQSLIRIGAEAVTSDPDTDDLTPDVAYYFGHAILGSGPVIENKDGTLKNWEGAPTIAAEAYAIAEAMLAERVGWIEGTKR